MTRTDWAEAIVFALFVYTLIMILHVFWGFPS